MSSRPHFWSNSTFTFNLSRLVVPIRRVHIDSGEGRSCQDCAISMALRDAFAEAGLPRWGTYFVPYAMWETPMGLILGTDVLRPRLTSWGRISVRDLPEGAVEWARDFDEWGDFQCSGETKRQYERRVGYWPSEPCETVFTFDLSKIIPCSQSDL